MQFMLITAVYTGYNNKILPQSCVGEFCMALTYRGKCECQSQFEHAFVDRYFIFSTASFACFIDCS